MPAPDRDFIRTTSPHTFSFALEPVRNILNSLFLITKLDYLSGLDPWVTQIAAQMTPEQMHNTHLVCMGLHYAIQPVHSFSDFPTYLDDLAQQDSVAIKDRILNAYDMIAREYADPSAGKMASAAEAMASEAEFRTFLQRSFDAKNINFEIEMEAYRLLLDPPAMQNVVVSYLRRMWEQYLKFEWNRVKPMLQESVEAFKQVDFGNRSVVEVADEVVGQEFTDKWQSHLHQFREIVFVPSAHMGPYITKFFSGPTLGIFFGARLPAGAKVHSPALTRSELLVRLGALDDDSRLRVLKLISDKKEWCAKDIMTELELSQSAASRHLRQLSAAGYVNERRREGAKCYTLNPTRFDDTFEALKQFLSL